MFGYVDSDDVDSTNERMAVRVSPMSAVGVRRQSYVRIIEPAPSAREFLARIVEGPYYAPRQASASDPGLSSVTCIVEIEAELRDGVNVDTQHRPIMGSKVDLITDYELQNLLRLDGEMLLGSLADHPDVLVRLKSSSKDILARNVGVFGTVGSGKSNTAQVLIEEASQNGWAVCVLDIEGEYTQMSDANEDEFAKRKLAGTERAPGGIPNFFVYYLKGCGTGRADAIPFTLRAADFEPSVIAEIMETTFPERNAFFDCVEFFEQKSKGKMAVSEADEMMRLLNSKPGAPVPYQIGNLKERASERSPRSTEFIDFFGLAAKLKRMQQTEIFDRPDLPALDPERMLQAGHVSIVDISLTNDVIKNLVITDLMRKIFSYKIVHPEAPPTLIVIEEAHSFISKDRVETMKSTMQMLRNVARRGRKRWLGLVFVSQQPGHLPSEIFELCNTRFVHTVRSMHNLQALEVSAGDVGKEVWSHCPMLGPGEAVISSPQYRRPIITQIRPASSKRKFTD